MHELEKTGEKFNLELYLSNQQMTKDLTRKIANHVCEGTSEADGQQLVTDEFKKIGVTKFWHPTKFRIASDTTKSFRELPDQTIKLKKGDLFFLDVGPIIDDHEADYGETFIFDEKNSTDEVKKLQKLSEEIWQATNKKWKMENLKGVDLFMFSEELAKKQNCSLNPLTAGHRLGDFPHALFSKEKLFNLNFSPTARLWVLEIQVINSSLKLGSFYENILF